MNGVVYMTEESANDIAIRIDVESIKVYTKAIIKMFFERYFPEKDTKELQETFNEKYDELLLEHEKNDKTDLSRLYRLITLFKPVLETVLEKDEVFNTLCDRMVELYDNTLAGVRRKLENKIKRPSDNPILPGNND